MNSELSLHAITKYLRVLLDSQADQNLTIGLVSKDGNSTKISEVSGLQRHNKI